MKQKKTEKVPKEIAFGKLGEYGYSNRAEEAVWQWYNWDLKDSKNTKK